MHLAVTGPDLTESCKGQRAGRRTRTRFLNYKLRNHEPWGYEPTTGEALFDHGCYLNQFSDCDNRRFTHHALGFVMPYSQLTDVLFTNSMEIGRSKLHSGSGTRKRDTAREKGVNLKRRPAAGWDETCKGKKAKRGVRRKPSPSPSSPTEMPVPTPTPTDDCWGDWGGQGR